MKVILWSIQYFVILMVLKTNSRISIFNKIYLQYFCKLVRWIILTSLSILSLYTKSLELEFRELDLEYHNKITRNQNLHN